MDSIAGARSSTLSVKSRDQRPPLSRGRKVRPLPWPDRRLGSISARRLSKPSAVIMPAATSSQRSASTSDFSFRVPRTMSAKNNAPRLTSRSRTSFALRLNPLLVI